MGPSALEVMLVLALYIIDHYAVCYSRNVSTIVYR